MPVVEMAEGKVAVVVLAERDQVVGVQLHRGLEMVGMDVVDLQVFHAAADGAESVGLDMLARTRRHSPDRGVPST